jgi:hypothetical protein
VNVQGAGVAVSNVAVVNSTTVAATFRVSVTAVRSSRSVTVATSTATNISAKGKSKPQSVGVT